MHVFRQDEWTKTEDTLQDIAVPHSVALVSGQCSSMFDI